MSQDPPKRDDEQGMMRALFRYAVIAPIVEADGLAYGQTGELIEALSAQSHFLPGKGPVVVKERTIYEWLRRYRQGGLDALLPRVRKDKGKGRVVDEQIVARAIELRKENPQRWTSTLLDIMQREGTFDGKAVAHRSTLDRHLARRGMSRRQIHVLGAKRTIKMKFDNFGDLWVGDYHHGPVILGPNGKPTTAKLAAFIDHATRYAVADRYYLAEDIATLRDCLYRALLAWGAPRKAYVDRGSVYRCEQLAYSLDRIHTKLIHSRAYYSQGRGVIERWWQTVRAFESEVRLREELLTLHELNRLWEAYRELRYCQKIHSELGITPKEAISGVIPRAIDPQVARELFLVRADRTVHKKDGCVSVEGIRYLCDSSLRGQKLQVRYDPNDLSCVLIFREGKRLQKAFPQQPNAEPEPHPQPVEPPTQSVDYLALLREDFDRQLLQHARPLAYCQLEVQPEFDLDRFVQVICQLAGLSLRPSGHKELAAFWNTFGPLPEEIVRIGTEHAVRLHGRGRHLRVYLHAIRTLVLAHWQNPTKEDEP
jgi:putative transposase